MARADAAGRGAGAADRQAAEESGGRAARARGVPAARRRLRRAALRGPRRARARAAPQPPIAARARHRVRRCRQGARREDSGAPRAPRAGRAAVRGARELGGRRRGRLVVDRRELARPRRGARARACALQPRRAAARAHARRADVRDRESRARARAAASAARVLSPRVPALGRAVGPRPGAAARRRERARLGEASRRRAPAVRHAQLLGRRGTPQQRVRALVLADAARVPARGAGPRARRAHRAGDGARQDGRLPQPRRAQPRTAAAVRLGCGPDGRVGRPHFAGLSPRAPTALARDARRLQREPRRPVGGGSAREARSGRRRRHRPLGLRVRRTLLSWLLRI